MKKIVLTIMLLFTFALPGYAEIAYFQNEFTSSKVIVSSIDRDKKTDYSKAPNNITLRKEFLRNNTNFTLIILTTKSSIPAILDKTHFKFNSTNFMSLKTSVDPDSYSLFFELDDDFIKAVSTATSMQIQTPMYSNNKNRIKYKEYDISPDVLNEWKQVIAME